MGNPAAVVDPVHAAPCHGHVYAYISIYLYLYIYIYMCTYMYVYTFMYKKKLQLVNHSCYTPGRLVSSLHSARSGLDPMHAAPCRGTRVENDSSRFQSL